jgi:hypothetical protein
VVIETEVPEQHATREEQSGGVGLVLALDVKTDVTAARLEDSDLAAHVAARNDTRATDEGSTNVGENATVEVRHDHDVELLRAGNSLHGGIVDNHVVDLKGRVLLGDLVEGAAEQTVGKLHDVGLVDAGNLGAAVGKGESEGELRNALRLGAGDDLERLNNAGNALVLETRVLALGVLTDNAQIDILVTSLVARDVLDEGDRGVDVELLTHSDVEGRVARAVHGSVEDTLETELVPAEGGNALAESLLGAGGSSGIGASRETRDLDLLPLNGNIVGLEDGLDGLGNFGTNTVTGDEGDGVLAAELGRLEDVGLDGREGAGGGGEGRVDGGAAKRLGGSGSVNSSAATIQ